MQNVGLVVQRLGLLEHGQQIVYIHVLIMHIEEVDIVENVDVVVGQRVGALLATGQVEGHLFFRRNEVLVHFQGIRPLLGCPFGSLFELLEQKLKNKF